MFALDTAAALTLLLVLARMAGLALVAPVLSHAAVAVRLRVLLAVAMALAVVSRVPTAAPHTLAELALGLGGELALGAMIGLAVRLVFAGVEMGAFQIGQQLGLNLGEVYDPSTGGGDATRKLFEITAVVVFLSVGGHRAMIGGLIRTFETVPLMGFSDAPAALTAITATLAASFVLALKVAAPVLAAMVLATIALGMLQRVVPQMHILSVGLPVRAMVGLLAMAGGLVVLGEVMEWGLDQTWHGLAPALR